MLGVEGLRPSQREVAVWQWFRSRRKRTIGIVLEKQRNGGKLEQWVI
jgi:hypothetical protein